jgi:hypothetical protein
MICTLMHTHSSLIQNHTRSHVHTSVQTPSLNRPQGPPPPTVLDESVHRLHVPQPRAAPQRRHVVRHAAHRLHPARNNQVRVACGWSDQRALQGSRLLGFAHIWTAGVCHAPCKVHCDLDVNRACFIFSRGDLRVCDVCWMVPAGRCVCCKGLPAPGARASPETGRQESSCLTACGSCRATAALAAPPTCQDALRRENRRLHAAGAHLVRGLWVGCRVWWGYFHQKPIARNANGSCEQSALEEA